MGHGGAQVATNATRTTTAVAPSLDGRFLIWRGASGRVYVFSPADDDMPLDDAVLIVVSRDRVGRPIGARPIAGVDGSGGEIWAHHLAETPAARRAAAADLAASGRGPEAFGAKAVAARRALV